MRDSILTHFESHPFQSPLAGDHCNSVRRPLPITRVQSDSADPSPLAQSRAAHRPAQRRILHVCTGELASVEADGLLYLAAGYVGDKQTPNKPVYVVRPGGEGDLTLPEGTNESRSIAWMQPNASSYNPSPLVYQGRLYVLWDFGFLSCRDARTSKELYEKQRLKSEGTAGFTASPWAYRGRVFCLSEDGDTYVVMAGDTYKSERINSLGEMCMATPAILGDRLILRTLSHVYCVKERAP